MIRLSQLLSVSAAIVCAALGTADATAQCESARLTASDASQYRGFGRAIACEGDTAVLTSPAGFGSSYPGTAYVFERSGAGWTERQALTASDGYPGDSFGLCAALSGDVLVLGRFGRAYVFEHDGLRWNEAQILTVPNAGILDWFGLDVAVDGDTIAVGAAQYDGPQGESTGTVFVFVRGPGGWNLQQQLSASNAARGNLFGDALALEGDRLLVAAPLRDHDHGVVYEFLRTGSSWSEGQQLVPSDAAQQGSIHFGYALDLDGDSAVVTALVGDGRVPVCGSAYVFVRGAGGWSEQQKLFADDGAFLDDFGRCAVLSGDTCVIGAPLHDRFGATAGAVYGFTRAGTSWRQEFKWLASDAEPRWALGAAVGLTGTQVFGGEAGYEGAGPYSGRVDVFELDPTVVVHFNGHGINRDTLSAGPTRVGQTWNVTLGVEDAHTAGVGALFVSSACFAGFSALGGQVEYLLGGARLVGSGPVAHTGTGSTAAFALAIPGDPALIGLRWAVQGAVLGGSNRLTNAAAGAVQ